MFIIFSQLVKRTRLWACLKLWHFPMTAATQPQVSNKSDTSLIKMFSTQTGTACATPAQSAPASVGRPRAPAPQGLEFVAPSQVSGVWQRRMIWLMIDLSRLRRDNSEEQHLLHQPGRWHQPLLPQGVPHDRGHLSDQVLTFRGWIEANKWHVAC